MEIPIPPLLSSERYSWELLGGISGNEYIYDVKKASTPYASLVQPSTPSSSNMMSSSGSVGGSMIVMSNRVGGESAIPTLNNTQTSPINTNNNNNNVLYNNNNPMMVVPTTSMMMTHNNTMMMTNNNNGMNYMTTNHPSSSYMMGGGTSSPSSFGFPNNSGLNNSLMNASFNIQQSLNSLIPQQVPQQTGNSIPLTNNMANVNNPSFSSPSMQSPTVPPPFMNNSINNNNFMTQSGMIGQQPVPTPYSQVPSYPSSQVPQQLPYALPQLQQPKYFYEKGEIDIANDSNLIVKKSAESYTSVFMNARLVEIPSMTYAWKTKVVTLDSWIGVGVTSDSVVQGRKHAYSPYDEHGGYLLSGNGYIWSEFIDGANKYKQVQGSSFASGDILIFELNCDKKELTIYNNKNVKKARLTDIKFPVYPSVMMHGKESIEWLGFIETNQMPSANTSHNSRNFEQFLYLNYHINEPEPQRFVKKTEASYTTIFANTPLGDDKRYGIFRWKVHIHTINSWIGVGVTRESIVKDLFHELSPFDNHGSYLLSQNGYAWNLFIEGSTKYKSIGSKFYTGDVLTFELNCFTKELSIFKEDVKMTTFSDVQLPVYPSVMMHSLEEVEFSDFEQASLTSKPISYDNVLNYRAPKYLIQPNVFDINSNILRKTVADSYSTAFVNLLIGQHQKLVRWKIKVISINSWLGVGVTNSSIVDRHQFTFSPYDQHASYLLSHNGYVWDQYMDSANKYKQVEGSSFAVGDTIIVELNCVTKEISFYKNNMTKKLATLTNVKFPVYPSIMCHGREAIEYSDFSESTDVALVRNKVTEFVYDTSHIQIVDAHNIKKTSASAYTTVFVNTPLGTTYNSGIIKWKVKIISLISWIGLGVIMRDVADDHNFGLSPYDSHGSYLLSGNGYIWNQFMEGTNKYEQLQGASFSNGDTIVMVLDCDTQELNFYKSGKNIATFSNVKIPVYPSFKLHGTEQLEFSWGE
ncbi:hypothetical protein FDP41_009739 [Naegleria fowleri]|uniref:B30.2/SPRY domain-containing protein n=1 Tax=Naegleria fowleri TaxID=5763 RepID=A0A6A5AVD1_NAEFO|nr:uncharacterized protein FDP41_009739 [Naegleria fowleri]KAF0972043.1 hypothetical protein FDP41_009739 [Naegleria fowleri]